MRQHDRTVLRTEATSTPGARRIGHRVSRRDLLRGGAALALWAGAAFGGRPAAGEALTGADTSRETRDLALRQIPYSKMTRAARSRVSSVVSNPTLFRRMPVERITCDAELFIFLVRYPEVIVSMWDLMGATQLRVRRVDDFVLDADDGAGTVTKVELLYGDKGVHVMYAEGEYAGPLFKGRLTGRCVLVLNTHYENDDSGECLVTSQLDVFMALDNIGAELVARTLHAMMGRTADRNYSESAKFVSQVSHQAAVNPPGMQQLAQRLSTVKPAVRKRFAELVASVATRLATRPAAESESQPVYTSMTDITQIFEPPLPLARPPEFRR